MKARLTDPKCIYLKRGRVIFDNLFTRLKYILCNSLLSLMFFFYRKITLARMTPQEATARDIQKSSIIRSAQTTLGGMNNKNPKGPKDLSFSAVCTF
jgi:hypothetical protein